MINQGRRRFLRTTSFAAGAVLADLSFLRPLGYAAASNVSLDPRLIEFGSTMDPLVELIRKTPREECVPVFVRQLQRGMSYQDFLAALFLSATQTGDMHQMAQVYGAHRVSSRVRIEERLLPLFWILDRVKQSEESEHVSPYLRKIQGPAPDSSAARSELSRAMRAGDKNTAELAVVILARDEGPQQAMRALWDYAPRDLGGTLGHTAIGVATASRTLDAIGWQHAEAPLRYLAHELSRKTVDETYSANVVRANRTAPRLPTAWAGQPTGGKAAMALYDLIRVGKASQACDFVCSALLSQQATAGDLWDAIALASADVIFRYKTGGVAIGGMLVHVVTSTNALRYGFERVNEPTLRLLFLLQAAGYVSDWFVKRELEQGNLRDIDLVRDLRPIEATQGNMAELFETLPTKGDNHEQVDTAERAASDAACRAVFPLLSSPANQQEYVQTARGLLCLKASGDPHDFKFPSAAFEEVSVASPQWRPYLLAASIHALHGTRSPDAKVLVAARDALA